MKWVHFCHISLSYLHYSGRGLRRLNFSLWNFKCTSICIWISFSLLDVKKWVVLHQESLYGNNVPILQGVSFVTFSVCVLHVSAIRPRAGRWACLACDCQIQSLLINGRSKRCGCGWNEDRKRLCAITLLHERVWLMIALAPQNVSGWSSRPSGDSVFHSFWLFFFSFLPSI